MADDQARNRILSWEQAHTTYNIGSRAIYVQEMLDQYSGKSLQKKNRDPKTGKTSRSYPLAVNYNQTIVQKLNSLMWGQYDDMPEGRLILWRVPVVKEGWGSGKWQPRAEEITNLLNHVFYEANPGCKLLYQWGLDSGICGTGILGLRYDILEEELYLDSIPATSFHCIWRADSSIAEVCIITKISVNEAKETGWDQTIQGDVLKVVNGSSTLEVERTEYWSPTRYTVFFDNKVIKDVPNPYMWTDEAGNIHPGIIPFVVLSNKTMVGEFYGHSDIEPTIDIIYEMNHSLAMMGDIVSETAHPIKVLKNQRGDQEKWTLGSDRTWKIAGADADAFLLTTPNGLPAAEGYIKALQTILEDTSNLPAVAYGRFKGTQGSSLMLQVEMAPALEMAQWKRLVATDALQKLARMVLTILATPANDGIIRKINGQQLGMKLGDVLKHSMEPVFAPMLPKDRVTQVNEQITLVGAKLRSINLALKELNVPNPEEEAAAIQQDKENAIEMAQKLATATTPPPPSGEGGKSSTKSSGGKTTPEPKSEQMQPPEQAMLSQNQQEARGQYVTAKSNK
jgi:hypothetical protein